VKDRLGSVRTTAGSAQNPAHIGPQYRYLPYGEEEGSPTPDGPVKFATYERDSTASAQDYAQQRYYSNVYGRFFSPDPGGVKTANPRDPGSWNRYAYVQGDPVNFYDPHGTNMFAPGSSQGCGPNWMWDASLSGPCSDWWWGFEDWGGGGGGGRSGFVAPADPHPYETATQRIQRAAAIAATILVIAQELAIKAGGSSSVWPTAIQLSGMSCTTNYAGAYQLNVTYNVISDLGTVMTSDQLAGVSISEHFLMQTGNLGNLNSQAGNWSYPASISQSGQFTDILSSGDLPGFPRSGTALQEFTASGSFGIQPLDIFGFSGNVSGVNFNTYSHFLTTVNGMSANGPCK
jgi:RHS repeat-associated protein